jgi:hypothetical protein
LEAWILALGRLNSLYRFEQVALGQWRNISERDDVADQETKSAREQKDIDKRIARLVNVIADDYGRLLEAAAVSRSGAPGGT